MKARRRESLFMDKFPRRRQFSTTREMLHATRRTRRVLAEDDPRQLDEAEAALRALEEEMSLVRKPQQKTKRFPPH
jgi:Tfp pilus assembly protein PilX